MKSTAHRASLQEGGPLPLPQSSMVQLGMIQFRKGQERVERYALYQASKRRSDVLLALFFSGKLVLETSDTVMDLVNAAGYFVFGSDHKQFTFPGSDPALSRPTIGFKSSSATAPSPTSTRRRS